MIGEEVHIRIWDENPSFWDHDGFMMSLAKAGDTYTVIDKTEEGYYILDHVEDYIWRSVDLIPVNRSNPNYLFKLKNNKKPR
jgi:hypothetical protein